MERQTTLFNLGGGDTGERDAPSHNCTDAELNSIVRRCEYIAALQQGLKRRVMIYQVDQKEELALQRGLPADTYHHLSYEQWTRIRCCVRHIKTDNLVQGGLF